jgi:hypothetical protein
MPQCPAYNDFPLEQKTLLNLFSFVKSNVHLSDEPMFEFVNIIITKTLKSFEDDAHNFNKHIFNSGLYFNDEQDTILKKQYHDYRDECKSRKQGSMSYDAFVHQKGGYKVDDTLTRPVRQKIIKVPHTELNQPAKSFFSQGHVGTQKDKKDINIGLNKKTIPLDSSSIADEFLDLLCSTDIVYPSTSSVFEDFLLTRPGLDNDLFTKIKTTSINQMREWIEEMKKTNIYNYMKLQTLVNEQLMHFLQFSLPNNQYAMFNSGLTNQAYLLPIGYQNKGNDAGKSFLSF